jgi:hypothetical protein
MAVPPSLLSSKNSFRNRCTAAPKGYRAKYLMYSVKLNAANARENAKCVKAGYDNSVLSIEFEKKC